MRIAHLPASFLPVIGGAEIATHNIAAKQSLMGHDVSVLAHPSSRKKLGRSTPYKLISYAPGLIWTARKLRRYGIGAQKMWEKQIQLFQRRYRFDVWHFNSLSYHCIFSLPALRRLGVPAVLTCQGSDIQVMDEIGYGHRLDPEFDAMVRSALNESDIVTAISGSVREEYLKIGVPPARIRDIPNGADVARIREYPVERGKVRKRMGWPEQALVILTVGRNHPKKGYSYIPEIIMEIVKERRDFLWVIVGKGCGPVYEKAKGLCVEDFLKVIPELGVGKIGGPYALPEIPSGDLIDLYGSADVFAFPTLLETFGNVQIEAMAAGLPVVTTNAPGCRDIVNHGVNGLVSQARDVAAMAENILRVFSDGKLRENLIAGGLETALKHGWDAIAGQYCSAYGEAISMQGTSRGCK